MPFKSKVQVRYLFAHHPRIALRWAKTYGIPRSLPKRVKTKR